MNLKLLLLLALGLLPLDAYAQHRLPIIDMHLHATDGNLPWAVCIPWVTQGPAWDPKRAWKEVWHEAVTSPPCPDPIWPPKGEEAVMQQTVAVLDRRNIIGVLSGPPERVLRWRAAAPSRFIPSVQFQLGPDVIIEEASFLSEEQKRDIFYNNAARFLRFSAAEIAKHHR
jgi:hypothetical protein